MRFLLAGFLCLYSLVVTAQTGALKGKLLDTETKEPLIGATVLVEGTTLGGITDLNGEFLVKSIPAGTRTIRFKYVGYEDLTQEVTITEGQTATLGDVALTSTAIG